MGVWFVVGSLILAAVGACAPTGAPLPPTGPPDNPRPTIPRVAPLRFGSWNIRKLGHGSSKDVPLVARIIEERFDLLALQEVMQKAGGHPGYDRLLEELGESWRGVVTATPRPHTSAGHAEYYAVVYRARMVRLCDGWQGLRFITDHDGGPAGVGPDRFQREPAYGCFRAGFVRPNVGTDFMLGVFHATFADGRVAAIREEVTALGQLFTAMAQAAPGEGDLWLIGDLNLTPKQLAKSLPFSDRTQGQGSTLGRDGEPTSHLYDHLVVANEGASPELRGDAVVLDVRSYASDPVAFLETVSDHLPLWIEVRIGQRDDD